MPGPPTPHDCHAIAAGKRHGVRGWCSLGLPLQAGCAAGPYALPSGYLVRFLRVACAYCVATAFPGGRWEAFWPASAWDRRGGDALPQLIAFTSCRPRAKQHYFLSDLVPLANNWGNRGPAGPTVVPTSKTWALPYIAGSAGALPPQSQCAAVPAVAPDPANSLRRRSLTICGAEVFKDSSPTDAITTSSCGCLVRNAHGRLTMP